MKSVVSNEILSWGRMHRFSHQIQPLQFTSDFIDFTSSGSFLAHGFGRSYGDSSLNENGYLLLTTGLNRYIEFNSQTGSLICEAGVSLSEILSFSIPRGWILPVLPGTQFVSVGGAIANDIHGKNHHRSGTFGCHIKKFALKRSDGAVIICGLDQNSELFKASIGGLGLTGLILWAEIQLKPIASAQIDVELIKFKNLDDFLQLSEEADQTGEYTVAWIDSLTPGRGIFMKGNHSKAKTLESDYFKKSSTFSIPFDFPNWFLNKTTIGLFNSFYFRRLSRDRVQTTQNLKDFFFPLDSVGSWNRLYGKRGFFQFQIVLPRSEMKTISLLMKKISDAKMPSFLSVLKIFGSVKSPGLLSFPQEGITLAMDFAYQDKKQIDFFSKLTDLVVSAGGRIYPAKDSLMTATQFRSSYTNLNEFKKFIDPKFSSSFWRRVEGVQ